MGDLVRDALRAEGIDEEVEQLIANALVQSWNENRPSGVNVATESIRSNVTEPNRTKVRIIVEQLCRRLERIYNNKLQVWKQTEERTVEEMIAKLKHEYKENLIINQRQLEEVMERKDDELRNKEHSLREDIRMTFERKKLDCEKAWREIENAQREICFRKELLDSAQANFQSKKDSELYRIEQEKRSLACYKEMLKLHEKSMNGRLEETIRKTREEHKAEMKQLILEWNNKEAILSRKYELVWGKIQELATSRQFITQEAVHMVELEEEVALCQKKLRETELALYDALENQRKATGIVEVLKKSKKELSKENEKLKKKLKKREALVKNLKKRLKLVEELAAVRINDLRLHHKLASDKLQEIDKEFQNCQEAKELENTADYQHFSTATSSVTLQTDSVACSTITESSQFEENFHKRMEALDVAKQQLDFSLDKLRARSCSKLLGYSDMPQLPYAKVVGGKFMLNSLTSVFTNETNKTQSGVLGSELEPGVKSLVAEETVNTEKTEEQEKADGALNSETVENTIVKKSDITDNSNVDSKMLRYMKMLEEQEKLETTNTEKPGEEEN